MLQLNHLPVVHFQYDLIACNQYIIMIFIVSYLFQKIKCFIFGCPFLRQYHILKVFIITCILNTDVKYFLQSHYSQLLYHHQSILYMFYSTINTIYNFNTDEKLTVPLIFWQDFIPFVQGSHLVTRNITNIKVLNPTLHSDYITLSPPSWYILWVEEDTSHGMLFELLGLRQNWACLDSYPPPPERARLK